MTDPPRRKQRAKRQEPAYVVDPNKPNATIELETADLVSLATGGLVEGKVTKTRELQLRDREELGDRMQDPKIIVDLGDPAPKEPNVFVDLGDPAPKSTPAPPRTISSELRAPKRGLGLVVLVYVIAAGALATSIYVRWFA